MNSLKEPARRLQPALGQLMPATESALTFAAIWDPDRGLETFAGQDLLDQQVPKRSKSPVVSVRDQEEPFAIFGSRAPYFVDVRTASAYECWLNGVVDPDETLVESPLEKTSFDVRCVFH